MRVLLDTHVFLWWVEGDCALPAKARTGVSPVAVWNDHARSLARL